MGLVGRDDVVADRRAGGSSPRRRRRVRPAAPRSTSTAASACPQPAGPPGHPPGRRQRRGPRAGRRAPPTPSSAGTRKPDAARAFYADVKGRLAALRPGARRAQDPARPPPSCSATPRTRPTSGPATSAASRSARQTAILLLEQVWNRDLSGYDPDGPLPDDRPRRVGRRRSSRAGRGSYADPLATAAEWRARAEAEEPVASASSMIEVTGRQTFVGTPTAVADADRRLRADDGGRRASSSSPTSPRAASTTSSTGSWSRCCRSAARCARVHGAAPCAATSACRRPRPSADARPSRRYRSASA